MVTLGFEDREIFPPAQPLRLAAIVVIGDLEGHFVTKALADRRQPGRQASLDVRHDPDPGTAAVDRKAPQRVAQRVFGRGMRDDDDGRESSLEHLLDLRDSGFRSDQLAFEDHAYIRRKLATVQNAGRLACTGYSGEEDSEPLLRITVIRQAPSELLGRQDCGRVVDGRVVAGPALRVMGEGGEGFLEQVRGNIAAAV